MTPTPCPRADEAPNSRAIATVLDDLVRIPGTNLTIGADAPVGLVPGVGDTLTTVLAGVILTDAVRLRVPLPVLWRMVTNCLVDAAVGQLPVVGDAADFAIRSNRKNMRLLDKALADPARAERGSVAYLVAAGAMVAGTLAVMLALAGLAVWMLLRLLGVIG